MKRAIIGGMMGCALLGCAASRETFEDSTQPIEMRRGAAFDLLLKSNQSTGYRWLLVDSAGLGPLRHVGTSYVVPRQNRNRNGAGGTERWTFSTPEPGNGVVTLVYARPWERAAAKDTARFRVHVR
jgi:inhibitor of cysteine peptidase